MLQRPHLVVFDLDGTLVDAFGDIAASLNHALIVSDRAPLSVEVVKTLVGEGIDRLIRKAAPNGTQEEWEAMRAAFMNYYSTHPGDHATVYPGMMEVVEAMRAQGVGCAILSNKPHSLTIATCQQLGITSFFDDIQGEDFPSVPRKPEPAALLAQMARLGAKRTVLVGDGLPDGQTARNAKVAFVACLWGTRTREELSAYNPIGIAAEPTELKSILSGFFDHEA